MVSSHLPAQRPWPTVYKFINSLDKFSRACKMWTLIHLEPHINHMFQPHGLQFKMCIKLLDLKGLHINNITGCLSVCVCLCLSTHTHTHVHIIKHRQALLSEIKYTRTPTLTSQKRMLSLTIYIGDTIYVKSWNWEFRYSIGSISEYSNFKLLLGHFV